jgi:hypothetical protein
MRDMRSRFGRLNNVFTIKRICVFGLVSTVKPFNNGRNKDWVSTYTLASDL